MKEPVETPKPADSPKPKGALVALIASKAPDWRSKNMSEDAPAESGVEITPGGVPSRDAPEVDHGFRAVAKAFGIPPEREASAQAALEHYIRTCAATSDDAEEY